MNDLSNSTRIVLIFLLLLRLLLFLLLLLKLLTCVSMFVTCNCDLILFHTGHSPFLSVSLNLKLLWSCCCWVLFYIKFALLIVSHKIKITNIYTHTKRIVVVLLFFQCKSRLRFFFRRSFLLDCLGFPSFFLNVNMKQTQKCATYLKNLLNGSFYDCSFLVLVFLENCFLLITFRPEQVRLGLYTDNKTFNN